MVLLPKAIFLTKHDKGPPNMVDSSSMPPKSLYPKQVEKHKLKNQNMKSKKAASAVTFDRKSARRRAVKRSHVVIEIFHRDIASH